MSSRFPSTPPTTSTNLSSSSTPTAPPPIRPPPPTRPRRRVGRWIGRGLLGLLATLVLLVGGALALLHTSWGREVLRQQIVSVLRDTFPGGAELGPLGGSPLGTMTASGLVIFDPQHRPAIAIDRARIDLGLLALLRHTIQLEEISADGVIVQAFQEGPPEQQVLNLTQLMKPSDPNDQPSTWRIQLDDVRLTRASVVLTRPNAERPGAVVVDHFDELAIAGALTMEPRGPLSAQLDASGRWRERRASATVQAKARVLEGVVEVAAADASFGGLRAAIRDLRYAGPSNVAGTVQMVAAEGALRELLPTLPTSPAVGLNLRSTPVAAGILRVQLDASAGAARLTGDLMVTPTLARPRLAGQLRLADLKPAELLGDSAPPTLGQTALTQAEIAVDAALDLPSEGRPFSLDSITAELRATAALEHGATHLPLTATATLDHSRLVAEASGAAGDSQLRATADVTMKERNVLAIREARLFAHLTAGDIPAQLRQDLSVAGTIDLSLRASGGLNLANLLAPEEPAQLAPAPSTAQALASEPPPAAPSATAPIPPLSISGIIDGAGLRFETLAAAKVHVEMTPVVIATWPRGRVLASITGASSAGEPLPNVEVRAASEAAGVINVQARMEPRAGAGTGKPLSPEAKRSALASARQIISATAAAATALSPATAAAAAVATTTVNSATALASTTSKKSPPAPVAKPPSLLASLGATGKFSVDASIKLGRDYRSATISLRELQAGFQTLEIKGEGGEISVRPGRLEIKDLALRSNAGGISIDGVRTANQLTGEIQVEDLQLAPLAKIIPQLRGMSGGIDLRASGTLRGRALQAEVRGAARNLIARPGAAVVDAELIATVGPQLYHLDVHAKNGTIGEITANLDVDPPADPLDAAAWQRLDRSAIRQLELKSQRVNLAALQRAVDAMAVAMAISTGDTTAAELPADPLARGQALEGIASLDVALTPGGGTLRVTVEDLAVPGTPAPIDVAALLTLDGAGVGSFKASAQTSGITAITTAEVHLPPRPFEPASWAVISDRLPHAAIEIPSFVVDGKMAESLGLGDWRGRAAAKLELQRGLDQLRGKISFEQVRGGPLQLPVTVVADIAVEGGQTKLAAVAAIDGKQAIKFEAGVPLALVGNARLSWRTLPLQGTVTIGPLEAHTIARAFGASGQMLAADVRNTADAAEMARQPVTASGKVPPAQAAGAKIATTPSASAGEAAAAAGTTDGAAGGPPRRRLQGTVRGEAKLTGTLGDPALAMDLVIAGLGNQRNKIRELRMVARYTTGALHAELTGDGEKGGSLRGNIDLDVAKPREAKMALTATAFDLAPVARLVPSIFLGVTAQLDGSVRVAGLDPRTMQVTGGLTVGNIRLPIANQVGALTEGVLKLDFKGNRADITLDGKIESGKVALRASANLEGVLPRNASLDLTITALDLITPLTPKVDGNLHADVRLVGGRWKVDAKLSKSVVRIPVEQGRVLHPVGPPPELVFVTDARSVKEPPKSLAQSARSWAAGRARNPWLEIALVIEGVTVRSAEATGLVRGKLDVAISDDGLSLDGGIYLGGGDVNLFGRRYQVDHAVVTFDGPLDPVIDAEIRHTFPQLVLNVAAVGRASDLKLRFASSPAIYSEAQLLGFFLGGNPGSGRDSTPDAANSVAAAVASQTLGGYLTRQLPVRIDVLSYQPQTLSSSGAFVAGRWITEKLLLLLRSRSDPRPLENSAEAELQYLLRRDLLLDGVAGDRGTFGLDLLWNRRW